jgi:hypothetical protein
MKKITPFVAWLLLLIFLLLILIFILIYRCNRKKDPDNTGSGAVSTTHFPKDSAVRWADWNILFKTSSTDSEKKQVIKNLTDSIGLYLSRLNSINKRSDSVNVNYVFCPCDTLLYNLTADISLGAVGTLATNPPKIPPTGPQGDFVQNILQNNPFNDNISQPGLTDTSLYNSVNYTPDTSRVLAIMDAGLDSTLFANSFHDLLWSDPNTQTIRNFVWYLNGHGPSYYIDEGQNKHGSAVTSTALEAIRRALAPKNKLPKVMVLKVLDSSGTGSSFSVSCALSYARQKKATLINASLGYFGDGEGDSILKHYVSLCNDAKPNTIPIVAAAGNVRGPRDPGSYKSIVNISGPNPNLLIDTNLFFPGCYSVDFNNVICVTGLHSIGLPCFYQNYSPNYVSVGVVTNSPPDSTYCCISGVHFVGQPEKGYDGSSFATPVVSGQAMAILLQSNVKAIDAVHKIGTTSNVGSGAVARKYIIYRSIP